MSKNNTPITMKGNPLKVSGDPLKEGDQLPNFKVTANDMKDIDSAQFKGKNLVILSVPSLDTPVCSTEAKRFNKEASALSDSVAVLVVSRDLPFAQARWCAAEGAERVMTASDYKMRTFGQLFGVELPDLQLLARAVFVADTTGKITYVDYVSEVAEEPNYEEVLGAIQKTLK